MKLFPVQLVDCINNPLAGGGINSLGIGEKENRIPFSPKFDTLIDRGQKSTSENAVSGARVLSGYHDYKAREVLV